MLITVIAMHNIRLWEMLSALGPFRSSLNHVLELSRQGAEAYRHAYKLEIDWGLQVVDRFWRWRRVGQTPPRKRMRITTPTVTLPTLPTWDGRGVRPRSTRSHSPARRRAAAVNWLTALSRSVYRHLYPPARNQPAPVCTARLAIDLERRLQRFPGYDSYKKKKNQKKEKKTTKK